MSRAEERSPVDDVPPPAVPASQLDGDGWDVIVVGGGPAGSTAARLLAAAGWRVLLLDRRRFPRDKACGDGLIPDALAVLHRHGLLERVRRLGVTLPGATFRGPWRAAVDVDVEVLTVRRARLDAALVAAAVERGAVLGEGLASEVTTAADGTATARVAGRAAPLRARYALVATGANVALLDRLGLVERKAASAVALRTYVHAGASLDRLLVSFDRALLPGYGWIFPMGDGWFNVGVGLPAAAAEQAPDRLRRTLERFVESFAPARALDVTPADLAAARGAMLRYGLRGCRPYAGGAVLATGEAVGSTFPLTGEGIGKAMETAERAAEALEVALATGRDDALWRYPTRLEQELRPRYRGYEFAERCAERAWISEWLLGRAGRNARLRASLGAILAETVDPAAIFSWRGLARALLA